MDKLIPKHGGYRKLKSFQVAQLIFDITIRFCNKYVALKSRTHDQMVQAARSGVQNIAEGSQASGTSKKTELKLTNVARASLEELRVDYQDFIRQGKKGFWESSDPRRDELVDSKFKSADQFSFWVKEVAQRDREDVSQVAANGMLILINVACSLLDRQLSAQAKAFQQDGGFTERLYKCRLESRKKP